MVGAGAVVIKHKRDCAIYSNTFSMQLPSDCDCGANGEDQTEESEVWKAALSAVNLIAMALPHHPSCSTLFENPDKTYECDCAKSSGAQKAALRIAFKEGLHIGS